MVSLIKKIIPFKIKKRYWRHLKNKERLRKERIKFDDKTPKEAFMFIYNTNYWNGERSVSGGGSDLVHTQTVIKEITKLIESFKLNTILDLPCGDFMWMQHVDLKGAKYTGGDIVDDLVVSNTDKFGGADNIQFQYLDLLQDNLPYADMIINRDCLVHFSFDHIYDAMVNIKNSKSKYLLTTTFTKIAENQNITTGEWRPINLEKPPFNFPPPIKVINEEYKDINFNDKSLGLWIIKDIELPDNAYSKN